MAEEGTTGSSTARLTSDQIQIQSELNELIRGSAAKQELINDLQKERNELLRQDSDILKDNFETMDRILSKFQAQIKDFEKLSQLEDQRTQKLKDHESIFASMAAAIEEAQAGTEEHTRLVEALNEARVAATREIDLQIERENQKHKLLMDQFKAGGRLEKLSELTLERKNDEGEIEKVNIQRLLEKAKSEQEIVDILEEASGYIDQTEKLQQKLNGHSEKFADTLGISSKFSKTSLGSVVEQVKQYQQLADAGINMDDVLESTVMQTLNLKNLFGSLVDEMKKMVVQLDSIGKKLGASTGMGNQFQGQIMSTLNATVMGGGTMEDASAAIGSLASGFSKFNPQADKTNAMLATTVVRLGKIGVSGDQAVKTMDFFTRTLRMTEEQSADMTTELALMGQQMGLTSSQIISDFQAVSSDLAIYGKNATDVFKDLEAQAKATGMQISSLVNVAKQFDTFDQAADKAAQLNAVLGTQLSSLELMNMSYDDRISYLRQEVSVAVGNLDGLDQYTQQFIAQAMGVGSVAEAQKMLNMSQSEYLKYQGDMAAANQRQEDLAKLTEDLVPTLEQFKLAFMKIATTLAPVITVLALLFDAIATVLTPITMLLDALSGWPAITAAVIGAIYGLVVAYKAWQAANFTLSFSFQTLQSKMIVVTGILLALGFIMENTDGPVRALALGGGVLALSMLLLKGQAWPVHAALAAIAALLGMRINPLLVNAFAFMAVGVLALAAAFAVLNYSGGSLALGLFVALAAAVALLVYSMRDMFEQMIQSGPIFLQAGLGLYVVAGGIAAIALAMALLGPLGVMGIAVLSLSLSKLGSGLETTASGLERISQLGNALSNLGNNGLIAISSEGNKISAVMGTGDVMNNFSAGKMEVEVKMPEMATPTFELKVELMGRELEAFIKDVVSK